MLFAAHFHRRFLQLMVLMSIFSAVQCEQNKHLKQLCTMKSLKDGLAKTFPRMRTVNKTIAECLKDYSSASGRFYQQHVNALRAALYHELSKQKLPIAFKTQANALLELLPASPVIGDGTCSICFEQPSPDQAVILVCQHQFCYECLFLWYTTDELDDKGTDCPMCKHKIGSYIQEVFKNDSRYDTRMKKAAEVAAKELDAEIGDFDEEEEDESDVEEEEDEDDPNAVPDNMSVAAIEELFATRA